MDYDKCRSNMEELVRSNQPLPDLDEANARLRLIDILFFDCLGWSRTDCVVESHQDGTRADYIFSLSSKILIVEAKRVGRDFILPVGIRQRDRQIRNLLRDSPDLQDPLKQVASYCQTRGVPIAVLCNGHQIIAFVAARSDGVAPFNGRALIFTSLEDMKDDFLTLWNYLSHPAVSQGLLESSLLGLAPAPLPPKLSAGIPGYPGARHRNPFQVELQTLSELILEDLVKTEDVEEQFLRECYCQSGALSQYALLSRDILRARYEALFRDDLGAPSSSPAVTREGISPEMVAEGISRRPIILLGDVGAGKTTFIRNLIKVEARDVFENALLLHIDLGAKGVLARNISEAILEAIDQQLLSQHGIDTQERSFIRGVYNLQLQRFAAGIYSDLRNSDPAAFQRRELEYLVELLAHRDEHMRLCLKHIARGRHKQIVIFLDNADQRNDADQQATFLAAQEMADQWTATVFVALRPETFHRSMQSGTLAAYHPRAFTIAPPRMDAVIKRRLDFGLKLSSGDIALSSLAGGTTVRLENLTFILQALRESLDERTELLEAIDNIAAGNVRVALNMVGDFLGSAHVDTEKIVRIRRDSGFYFVSLHEFMRAIIYGDARYYDSARSFIANMYDVSSNDAKEHFVLPATLSVVDALGRRGGTQGFVDVSELYSALQACGYTPHQIEYAVRRALEKALVETGRAAEREHSDITPDVLRVTSRGVYHLRRLIGMFVYYDAVVCDTPVLEGGCRERIVDAMSIEERLARGVAFVDYLDRQWASTRIPTEILDWPACVALVRQDMTNVRERLDRRARNNGEGPVQAPA